MVKSLNAKVRHNRMWSVSRSDSINAKVEYFSSSISPSISNDLQLAHWPSLQPCMTEMPWRNAASSTVSPSLTSISMPTGSKRTLWTASAIVLFSPFVSPGDRLAAGPRSSGGF